MLQLIYCPLSSYPCVFPPPFGNNPSFFRVYCYYYLSPADFFFQFLQKALVYSVVFKSHAADYNLFCPGFYQQFGLFSIFYAAADNAGSCFAYIHNKRSIIPFSKGCVKVNDVYSSKRSEFFSEPQGIIY